MPSSVPSHNPTLSHIPSSNYPEAARPKRLKQMRRRRNFVRFSLAASVLLALGAASAASSVSITPEQIQRTGLSSFHIGTIPVEEPVAEPIAHLKRYTHPLTPELRAKGYSECMMPDFGFGAYAPYRPLPLSTGGRMWVPKKGGHTEDMGFDVIVQFHGHDPVRKTLMQIARGVVYVGMDLGIGSGPYNDAFEDRHVFEALRHTIEKGLKAYTKDERAHIRHVGLSAWSAGYGAVNAILRHHAKSIDAVVLLDALHADYLANAPHNNQPESISGLQLMPTINFAKRAMEGEKIFYFTHSHVDPIDYPSTTGTAGFLLKQLGLVSTPTDLPPEKFGFESFVDWAGFHVRSYRGNNELAHCDHIQHIDEAVRDLIEPAWNTPAMDLSGVDLNPPAGGNIVYRPKISNGQASSKEAATANKNATLPDPLARSSL